MTIGGLYVRTSLLNAGAVTSPNAPSMTAPQHQRTRVCRLLHMSESMGERNRYTDEFRAGAVVMLVSQGYPATPGALKAVSDHLGVPQRTLSRWYRAEQNPPPAKLVTLKRGDLTALLRKEARAILTAMEDERGEANYRELGIVLGIVFDKLQLLEGHPTERTENTGKIIVEYRNTLDHEDRND